MSQLLLVGNPARRKHRKAPSPAQKRARAKFAAMARARSHTRSNPAKRRRVAKHHTHWGTVSAHKRRTNPARRTASHHRRRARRNPISSASLRNVGMLLKSAAGNAVGAIGVDVLMGLVKGYLPTMLAAPTDSSGGIQYGYYAAKGALAVGTGMALAKVIGANKAARVAEGSLTVTLHELMATFLAAQVSSVPMGAYVNRMPGGKILPMMPVTRTLRPAGMGAYVGGNAVSQREAVLR